MRSPYFCAELDPGLNPTMRRTLLTLKWALLFAPSLVLTDAQLLHTPKLQVIIRSPDFQQLLESRDRQGKPHILASFRHESVTQLLSESIDAEGRGARAILFGALTEPQKQKYEQLRKQRKLTLDTFLQIAPGLKAHFDEVQRLFLDGQLYQLHTITPHKYAQKVANSIDAAVDLADSHAMKTCLLELRKRAIGRLGQPQDVNRSDLIRMVNKHVLNPVQDEYVKKWCINLPYNRNTAENIGCNMLYSSDLLERHSREVANNLPDYQKRAWHFDSEAVYYHDAVDDLDRLTFLDIARIREKQPFLDNMTAFNTALAGDVKQAKLALLEHVRFLDREIRFRVGHPSSPGRRMIIDTFCFALEKKLQVTCPPVSCLPLRPLFSYLSDKIMVVLASPTRKALSMVGESIVSSPIEGF